MPMQMELKLSEFPPAADGRHKKKVHVCLSSALKPKMKPLTEGCVMSFKVSESNRVHVHGFYQELHGL